MCVSYRIREWHRSSVIVQIHSHTIKMLFNMKTRTRTWRPSVRHKPDTSAEETPSLPLVWCCSYSKSPVFTLFNLHIPAVCSWVKTLWTQNTATPVISLWIIRNRLIITAPSHTDQIIRQNETSMSRVWIQNHRSWWDTINRCCYSDVHIMIKSEPNTDDYELWHSFCWSCSSHHCQSFSVWFINTERSIRNSEWHKLKTDSFHLYSIIVRSCF